MADLLEMLCNESGVSGNEDEIRGLIINEITPYTDNVTVDTMGNIIAYKKGRKDDIKIMVTAHTDEAGFIVSQITDKGYVKFKPVGNIDERSVISKCVEIGDNKINGVIGMKAIHLQKKEEREKTVDFSDLYIDIGADSKKTAEKQVCLGDYVSFKTKFAELGNNIKGKAFASRIPCYCLIEALKKEHGNSFYAVFTAQSEVGNRGAQISSYGVNPDVVLTLDATESADMFGVKKSEIIAKIGEGAVVSYMDKGVIADKRLTDMLVAAMKENKIKFQFRNSAMGKSDAGAAQLAGSGAKAAMLGIPCRYLHTPVSIASKNDIKAMTDTINIFLNFNNLGVL